MNADAKLIKTEKLTANLLLASPDGRELTLTQARQEGTVTVTWGSLPQLDNLGSTSTDDDVLLFTPTEAGEATVTVTVKFLHNAEGSEEVTLNASLKVTVTEFADFAPDDVQFDVTVEPQ
jgi:hypothetical protein